MYIDARQQHILDLLTKYKSMTNDKLRALLFCSASTLRRDLIKLEMANLVQRKRGIVSLVSVNNTLSLRVREELNLAEKRKIADLAKDFVSDHMTLFIDNSSTTYQLCEHLETHKLTVVTNSLKTAGALNSCDTITCFTPGGQVKNHSNAVVGELALGFFDNFKADICFISCRGISHDGLWESCQNQAMLKRHMIRNAKKTILLLDSSKFESEHFFKLCDFNAIDGVISDQEPDPSYLALFERHDLDVLHQHEETLPSQS